jgi:hypothetical protein
MAGYGAILRVEILTTRGDPEIPDPIDLPRLLRLRGNRSCEEGKEEYDAERGCSGLHSDLSV